VRAYGDAVARILAVRARAHVPPDPELELEEARAHAARGDADWMQWLDDYANGRALVLGLRVGVLYEDDHGDVGEVAVDNRDVWIEAYAHPPKVAEQVRISASKDYDRLTEELRDRGVEMPGGALDQMYVEVTLDASLMSELETLEPMLCEGPLRRRLGDHA